MGKRSGEKAKRQAPDYIARRKHRGLPVLAAVVSLLAAVGIVSMVFWGVRLGVKLADKTEKYEKLADKIYPVVMFDPIAFENPAQLDSTVLLQMSMWSALLGENRDKYAYDDDMNLVVPASDLDVEAKKLFGDAVELEHQSFGDYEYNYRYTESSKTYSVPVGGQALQYAPRVVDIEKGEDGELILKVGYIAPTMLWDINTVGETEIKEPDKYMNYVLEKQDGGYIIKAVREMDYGDNYLGSEYFSMTEADGGEN